MKSKSTATILTFFLGGIGGHKFYLGQPGLGFLYLIFCWTFIPAILAFFNFLGLLMMSEDEFNMKYNRIFTPQPLQQTLTNQLTNQVNISNGTESDLDKLEKLFKLKESGAISEDEYQKKRSKILQD